MPVIVSGGMDGAEHIRWVFEHTGCAAVMLARGALGNPWLFAQVLGDARRASRRARRSSPSGDWVIDRADEHLGPGARRALPAQVPPLVRRAARRAARRVQDALQRADTLDEQRAVLVAILRALLAPVQA